MIIGILLVLAVMILFATTYGAEWGDAAEDVAAVSVAIGLFAVVLGGLVVARGRR